MVYFPELNPITFSPSPLTLLLIQLATMGGLQTLDEGPEHGLALTSEYRTAVWMGPAQYFDSRCMTLSSTYKVSAKVKLIHKDTGAYMSCVPGSNTSCPKLTMKYESGAWQDIHEGWLPLGQPATWDASGAWNTIEYQFTVSQEVADAGSVLMYSSCTDLNALIVLDDVSVQKIP